MRRKRRLAADPDAIGDGARPDLTGRGADEFARELSETGVGEVLQRAGKLARSVLARFAVSRNTLSAPAARATA